MYAWVVFLHMLGVFAFLLAHGASAAVLFKLRSERELDRIRAFLELSTYSLNAMYWSLLLVLITGIAAGILGNWWGRGWIWGSLGLIVALAGVMYFLGTLHFGKIRKAVGLPYQEGMKYDHPAIPATRPEELAAILAASSPFLVAAVGLGGIVVITWLMMFKPF